MDAERIQRQMQEVAVGNYRAFITAADALLAIRQEVSSIDKHLESLVNYTSFVPFSKLISESWTSTRHVFEAFHSLKWS